jgi:hypothetical protein
MYGNLDPPCWRAEGCCVDGRTGWAGGARSQWVAQLPLLAPTPLLTCLATPLLFCHLPVGGVHYWAGVSPKLPSTSPQCLFHTYYTYLPSWLCPSCYTPWCPTTPLFPPVLVAVACGDTSAMHLRGCEHCGDVSVLVWAVACWGW